jgi:hypothetical protein
LAGRGEKWLVAALAKELELACADGKGKEEGRGGVLALILLCIAT